MRQEIPEMPKAKRERLSSVYALKDETIEILLAEPLIANYFDELIVGGDIAYATLAANYLTADIFGLLKKENKELLPKNFPSVSSFKTLLALIGKGELSSRGAKDLLPFMLTDMNLDVAKTAEEKGLIQKNDPELLKKIVEEVIAESTTQIADYKAGKESMFMYFVGQCMKKSKGAGNPSLFQELLKEALK